jgi:hypothetical protein
MKATRTKEIKNRVFKKENLEHLWDKIQKKSVGLTTKSGLTYHVQRITINCLDGTTYESDNNDLLKPGEVLDTKLCKAIHIEYRDSSDAYIDLSLRCGAEDLYYNHITVRGERDWVSSTFQELEELINAVAPQDHWFIRSKVLVLHLGAFISGVFLFWIMSVTWLPYVPSPEETSLSLFLDKYEFIRWGVAIFLTWAMGLSPMWLVRNFILKLWPSIEFDFGPEHHKIVKKRRNAITMLFSVLILPFLINILSGLFFG